MRLFVVRAALNHMQSANVSGTGLAPASPALPALRDRWYLGELGYTRHDRFYNQKGSYGTLLLRTKVP